MTLRDALRTLLHGCRLAPWERLILQAVIAGAPLDSIIKTPSIVSAAEAASSGATHAAGEVSPSTSATASTPDGVASAVEAKKAHPWRAAHAAKRRAL